MDIELLKTEYHNVKSNDLRKIHKICETVTENA